MLKKCPICATEIIEPHSGLCLNCNWSLANDLLFNNSINELPEGVLAEYNLQVSRAKQLWNEKQDFYREKQQFEIEKLKKDKLIPRKITVSDAGFGDVETIGEALTVAKDGDTITILPGTYRESLTIDKRICLEGFGDDVSKVLIESDNVFTFHCDSPEIKLKNIFISNINQDVESNVIDIINGRTTINNCKIYGNSICLGLSNTAAAMIEGCEIYQKCQGIGIVAIDQSAFMIRKSEIHSTQIGIISQSSGMIHIVDNKILSCSVGIKIQEYSNPVVSKNFFDNIKVGIYIYNKGLGMITDNEFNNFEASGIEILPEANPLIQKNILNGSERANSAGIVVHGNGLGLIEDNKILKVSNPVLLLEGALTKIGKNLYSNSENS